MNPTSQKIIELWQKHKFWFKTYKHAPVRTSTQAASVRPDYAIHQGAKALILKIYPKKQTAKFVMTVLPGDFKLDKIKFKQELNLKSFRFATSKEVEEITDGVLPGGIPPLGILFGLATFIDDGLLDCHKIIFNAGDKSLSMAVKLKDYLEIAQPTRLSFAEKISC